MRLSRCRDARRAHRSDQDDSGAVLKRGDYTYFWSFDLDKPLLRPREVKNLTKSIVVRGPVLRAQIDSVLLADGIAYGRDESRCRQWFRIF